MDIACLLGMGIGIVLYEQHMAAMSPTPAIGYRRQTPEYLLRKERYNRIRIGYSDSTATNDLLV